MQLNLRHPLIKKILNALRSKSLYKKPAFWIGAGFLVLIVIFSFSKSDQPAVAVEQWAVVEKGDFAVEIVESGDVEAVSQRLVTTPMTSTDQIQVIDLVPEGKMVKKGEFLVQFDVSDLITKRDLAEQTLASAIADLNKMKAQQSLTISNMENSLKFSGYSFEQATLRLEAQQYESEAKKEQARLDLKQAEIDLKRVREQLESRKIINQSQLLVMETTIRKARNDIQTIRTQIDRLRLTSPIDGMVMYQEVGSWDSRERLRVGYKARSGEPLISIPDLSKMQVKLYLNEIDRAEISPGQAMKVILDAYPDTVFSGKVREVARLAQNIRGDSELKGFVVYADVAGRGSRLKPGLSARVRIEINRLRNVFTVPIGTVFEIRGQPVVYAFRKTRPVKVNLGPRNDAYVAVTGNLKKGMKLSWTAPTEEAKMLGYGEEKKRVDAANKTLIQSFSVFRKKGILYDYSKPPSEEPRSQPGGLEDKSFFRQRGPGAMREGSAETFRMRGQGAERGVSQGRGFERESRRTAQRDSSTDRYRSERSASGRTMPPDSVMRRFRSQGFRDQEGEVPDSMRRRFRMGGFRPGGGMPPDSLMRRFRNQDFRRGEGQVPDSLRRRFRMGSFSPGEGALPDSVMKRFQEEGFKPTPEMMRRFRETRKERRNEDSVSVQESQKTP
jgi:multidrug efflux pump subunit AcrA (membrane-fusion protein)